MPEYPYNSDIGQTELMGAAYNGDADEAARILSMPCDLDAQDSHGTPSWQIPFRLLGNFVVFFMVGLLLIWVGAKALRSVHRGEAFGCRMDRGL